MDKHLLCNVSQNRNPNINYNPYQNNNNMYLTNGNNCNTVFNQFYAYVNNLGKIILYGGGDTVRLLTLKQLFFDDYYFDDDLTPCGKEMLE